MVIFYIEAKDGLHDEWALKGAVFKGINLTKNFVVDSVPHTTRDIRVVSNNDFAIVAVEGFEGAMIYTANLKSSLTESVFKKAGALKDIRAFDLLPVTNGGILVGQNYLSLELKSFYISNSDT